MPSAENRRYVRVPFLCRVGLSAGEGPAIEANTVDVSLGGVGLISPRLVPKGRSVELAFHLHGGSRGAVVERVAGRVAFVRSDLDGHLLGIEFLEPLHRSRNPELVRRVERL